jgi:hypothetical protein
MDDQIPETVKEALSMWDADETVFTVEMGGLGPGYEQALQICAFEIMREFVDEEEAREPSDEWWKEKGSARRDAAVHRIDENLGLSGAQVGAATNLAFCVLQRGYREALRDDAVKDRLIQVNKTFPG